jgi:hypothetical protein
MPPACLNSYYLHSILTHRIVLFKNSSAMKDLYNEDCKVLKQIGNRKISHVDERKIQYY